MNILAGKFGGRKIKTNQKLPYRPTKSIVRKSLFDQLNPFSFDSVLDLFSGSGIFGFEAASRGANSITFVENNHKVINYLKQNSNRLIGPEYIFHRLDVFEYLQTNDTYDLIFADPPYSKYDMVLLAESVLQHLNKKGKFILECEKRQIPFMDASVRDYGQTRILYWENI